MSTNTTRLGLVKPAGSEPRTVTVLNANADKIDRCVGNYLVNDSNPIGSCSTRPLASAYDGLVVEEIGTGIIYTMRSDGSGGFTCWYSKFPFVFRGKTESVGIATGTPGTFTAVGYATYLANTKNSGAVNVSGGLFVAPVQGIYAMTFAVDFVPDQNGERGINWFYNGASQTFQQQSIRGNSTGYDVRMQLSTCSLLNKGDTISGGIWQNSGSTLAYTNYSEIALVTPTGVA